MRNATIATSRTRAATADHLIDYRPLPTAWGDLASLRQVRAAKARAAKARAAERGLDPSVLEIAAPSAQSAHSAGASHRRQGLLASLLREPGARHRPRQDRGHLATA